MIQDAAHDAVTGRFAPSPTGPLHFGSLVAAMGSYLSARSQGGHWLLRIEDIDPPREVPGAADSILRCLDALGFEWDGEVCYQSRRLDAYRAAAESLLQQGMAFYCGCSRKDVRSLAAGKGAEGPVYPGTCRNGLAAGRHARALRVRVTPQRTTLHDLLQGELSRDLEREIGDFVIHRADGLPAYQLAVVVDDHGQGVNEVVRGSDLLESTLRQLFLQQVLGMQHPRYAHLPVAVDLSGIKLSKQNGAVAIDANRPLPVLRGALEFLGQPAPLWLEQASVSEFWSWALANWELDRVPRRPAAPAGSISAGSRI